MTLGPTVYAVFTAEILRTFADHQIESAVRKLSSTAVQLSMI